LSDGDRSYHMTPDEFRRRGHEVVEWVARYLEEVESYPVRSAVVPGAIRAQLPPHPPEQPEPFADLVSSGIAVQGMLWTTSPACTELETHVLDWLIELLGLPERFRSDGPGGGVIQDTASSATLCAIVAARDRAGGPSVLPRLTAYTSTQAHSAAEKGMRVAGMRADQLRLVDVDNEFALRPDLLAAAIEDDLAAGRLPFLILATVGTTSSLAIDPVPEIAELCRRHQIWLHVDAAMAGSAAVVPELRFVNAGIDHADSWSFNPHKWLFTNFDCSVMYVADRAPLIHALSVVPEFLRNVASESGAVIDYRDWHIPLGRRFRALKLWFVLRHYGAEGLRHHVARHVELAAEFAARVDADPRLERLAPTWLSLVCFAHRGGDEATQRLFDGLNASGRAYLSHTRLRDRLAIRVSIGQTTTERRHVDALWSLVDELA
jgi:aromatic-L-amino-acid/L-tryptophan decarboxylase